MSPDHSFASNDPARQPPDFGGKDRGAAPARQGRFLPDGATIDDTYVVTGYLGSGCDTATYLIRHRNTKKEYALKFLTDIDIAGNSLDRLQNEINGLSRLEHPNIARVHDSGLYKGNLPFIVTDYVPGETLAQWIELDGSLTLIEALDVFIAVADALHFAHQKGLLHKNLSPANIMLTGASGTPQERTRVIDFGLSHPLIAHKSEAQHDRTAYQACYLSPEQCLNTRFDARSDIYSMAVCMFEALTGAPPFRGSTVGATMALHQEQMPPTLADAAAGKRFPEALEELIEQCLSKLPDDRLQSMSQVGHALTTIRNKLRPQKIESQAQDGVRIRPPARLERARALSPKKMALALTGGLLIGAALTATLLHSRGLLPGQKKAATAASLKTDQTTSSTAPAGAKPAVASIAVPVKARPTLEADPMDEPLVISEGCFYKGKVQKNGIHYVQFRFPDNKTGGTLSFIDTFNTSEYTAQNSVPDTPDTTGSATSKITSVEIKGLTLVPDGVELTFKPSADALTSEDYITGFRPSDLTGIDLSGQKEDLTPFLRKAFKKFTSLESIDLSNTSAGDDLIADITGLKKLQRLTLDHSSFTASGINKLAIKPDLFALSVSSLGKDTAAFVAQVSKAQKLNSLALADMPVKAPQVAAICKIPSLVALTLNKTETTLADLSALPGHPYFNAIHLIDCPVDPLGTVKLLSALKGLTTIELVNDSYDERTIAKCAQYLKRDHGEAQIITRRQATD